MAEQRGMEEQQTDGLIAVVAHGLLTSMSVVSAGIQTVRERWADLTPSERDELLERAHAHTAFVGEGLKAISKGLTEGAAAELEDQRPRRADARGEKTGAGTD